MTSACEGCGGRRAPDCQHDLFDQPPPVRTLTDLINDMADHVTHFVVGPEVTVQLRPLSGPLAVPDPHDWKTRGPGGDPLMEAIDLHDLGGGPVSFLLTEEYRERNNCERCYGLKSVPVPAGCFGVKWVPCPACSEHRH